ncbi:unnamed protein product [Sphagnum troendelagicum]|uniref:Solute carrier family 25 member 38 homolog n=1 Tax=Sphagnum troendelagicum TaxID=128251 RepID=A0ABP0UY14_9BRYO
MQQQPPVDDPLEAAGDGQEDRDEEGDPDDCTGADHEGEEKRSAFEAHPRDSNPAIVRCAICLHLRSHHDGLQPQERDLTRRIVAREGVVVGGVPVQQSRRYMAEAVAEDAKKLAQGRQLQRNKSAVLAGKKSLASFAAGGGAAMVSTTLLQPLDVIKTHMQAAESVHSRKFGAVLKNILAEDGVRGLWRGTGPACVRVGFGAGLYFAVLGPMLDTLKKTFGGSSSSVVAGGGEGATGGALRDKLPAFVTFSAGALTRALASSVVCPITVIKTRMEYAAASGLHYPSTFHAIAIITRTEGLRGLYSGLMPTLARDAPYSGLYLFMYNRLQHSLGESMPTGSPQASISFLAGAMAGGGATLLTHPPDVIRTRLQLEQGQHSRIWSTVQHIVKVHGMKGLFVGVMPRVGRRALQQAFAWTIYEEIARLVQRL